MDDTIRQLQKEELIVLDDAAVVVRKQDGKVKVKQATYLVGAGVVGGAFWGMLIGLFFWMPWLGLTIGAVAGAIAGALTDYGINDEFIKEVGATIKPGGSALFLLISKWTEDKALERLNKFNATIIRTFVPTAEIKGPKVVNIREENLGNIEDIMIDSERGRIAYVILSFGGLLGMGNKLFAIPWESLEYNRGDYILKLDRSILEKAEGFYEAAWTLTRDELVSVYKRCGIQPYWK